MDDSDEEKRLVLSPKTKVHRKADELIKELYSKLNIDNFDVVLQKFEALNKLKDKSPQYIEEEEFYLKVLMVIQDTTQNTDIKQLNKSNNKSFNKLKKEIKELNIKYEE